LASTAERKLRAAQSQISQIKSQIARLDATIDRRANPGKFGLTTKARSSAGLQRTKSALLFNLNVQQGRVATNFAEVVRQKTIKAQAKIKAQKIQAERQRKQEVARQKQIVADKQKKLVADAQAQKQREREAAERKKQAEIKKAEAVFESKAIQQEVKPAFESGEESFISNLEQKRLDDLETLEKTEAIERLEQGTGFFETGPGFKQTDEPRLQAGASRKEGTLFTVKKGEVTEQPIKNILDPSSSEGRFIEGQIQAQLGTEVESFLQTEKVLSAVKTGKGPKAAEVFEQTVTPELAEAGTRPGSTILLSAEEAGLAINRPSEGFPAISGDLIADVFSPGEFAREQGVDPFALAQEEREATGLKPREPVSIGNLLGFDTPPPKKKKQATGFPSSFSITSGSPRPSNDPITQLINAGLTPTKRPITSGFIPTDRPISSIGTIGKKPPRNIPLLIGGVQSTPKIISSFESNFGSFVTDIGKDFGFDIGSDFFSSISKSISFERSTSKEKIKKKSLVKFRAEQAKIEFAKKQKRAKAAGFSVGSKGKVFKFGKVKGRTVILAEGKTVKGLQKSIAAKRQAERIAKENARIRQVNRNRREKARLIRRAKRKKAKSRARKGRAKALGRVSGTKTRKVTKVSRPSKAKRSSGASSLFISGLTSSPGTARFGGGPSASGKKTKKPTGKSTPGVFGGGFGSGRRFG